MSVRLIVLLLLSVIGSQIPAEVHAQALNSGSNGSDGALNLTTPGEVVFNPATLGLDADRDNVFHFTTVTIGPGVTVKMPFNALQGLPVIWLATGAVQINGTIELNGQPGTAATPGVLNRASVPGPGGYAGGVGMGGPGFVGADLRAGLGPGGAKPSFFGNHAGHAEAGNWFQTGPAPAYGNAILVPLRGGSGGGGGGDTNFTGGSAGAGGGALRIFSSTSIALQGTIRADGGDGGAPPSGAASGGGGGSGGSIHLIAATITGSGSLSVKGGLHGNPGGYGSASPGRIRLDASSSQYSGTFDGFRSQGAPYNVPLPTGTPLVRVTSIGGISVPSTPTGEAATPDATINAAGSVTVAIEARNVPLGTVLEVRVMSGAVPDFVVNSTPLTGTLQLSNATAAVSFPPGFSRGLIRATWNPPVP